MDANPYWQDNKINKRDRQRLNGHNSLVIWFTGLSGSGKSTLANALEVSLHKQGVKTYLLDGDNIRCGLNKDLGFSLQERTENVRRVGEVARLFVDAGLFVLVSLISPLRRDRDFIRSILDDEFIEVYVKCPLEICEARDVKGLYKKARAGIIKEFTGISSIYEEPVQPDIVIKSNTESIEESVNKIMHYLMERQLIKKI